ncbi:hypothetical protein EV368DRAFT_82060 [Lentinula lateritia]|uniref:Uncharacterized protein n=1 Tax=Lentinula aff. lateritia TaxID=2804960 RepID=A0ACC1U4G9_9AGAR|nr:hypothetical protein F5876DRAFT_75312 [Lentinula aff. lateritia]KAJ3852916.1 hypothetical protein EV368DRAFT_82060 [Lentinula lateritia]
MNNTFIVDDQDASLKYTGNWSLAGQQVDFGQTASTGSTVNPIYEGNLITAVGDLYGGGTCNCTFSIDGALTNFTSAAPHGNQYQQTLWTSPPLNDGNHTFIYTVSSCNNSESAIWLDYLLYNTSGTTSVTGGTNFFDDQDSRIAYSGNWSSIPGEEDFRGTITSLGPSSSFLFDFEGTSIQVFGRVDNASIGEITEASFSVDGAPSVSFTAVTASNAVHNKQFYVSRPLDTGQHQLAVSNTGIIPLWIDYILVRGQTTISNAATSEVTGTSHRHNISVIVGSVVGGVCGTLLLFAIILLYRHFKRPKSVTHQHEDSPHPGTVDLADVVVPHRPQFVHHTSSSLSKASSISEEQRILTRRQLPLPPPQSIHDASASEFGYRDVHDLQSYLQPDLAHEGSYISLPNPYSTRHSHRSYSESSVSRSVTPSHTIHSTSFVHSDATPFVSSVNPTSEDFLPSEVSGYGFSFTPTRQIPRTTPADGEFSSDSDIKQRQGQFFVLSVDGMTASPLVHTDSGIRLLHRPRNNVYSELQPELPPMYTVE